MMYFVENFYAEVKLHIFLSWQVLFVENWETILNGIYQMDIFS